MNILKILVKGGMILLLGACGQIDMTDRNDQAIPNGSMTQQTLDQSTNLQNRRLMLMSDLDRAAINSQDLSVLLKIIMQNPEMANLIQMYLVNQDEAILDQLLMMIDQRLWENFGDCPAMDPAMANNMSCEAEPSDNADMLAEMTIEMVIDNFENPDAVAGVKMMLASYTDVLMYLDTLVSQLMNDEDIVDTIHVIAQSIYMSGNPPDSLITEFQSFEESL